MQSKKKPRQRASVRVSVTFPVEAYKTLDQIADQKKVSVAWVVRDAADAYIAAQWPLIQPRKN